VGKPDASSGMKKLGLSLPKKMELKKVPQSQKVHHPTKDPQSSNLSIEIKNNHSNYG
jgi:hypothetical protein